MPYDDTKTYLLSLLQRSRPETLFHYTSPGGLLGIVRSRQIWATAVEYLNDGLEWILADQMPSERMSELVTEGNKRFACFKSILSVEQSKARYDDSISGRAFVASFSRNGDLLSQWRAYSPLSGGFAVGIPFATLASIPHSVLVPCEYRDHEELCSKFLEHLADRYGQDDARGLYLEFLQARTVFAAALKHESFREENEWRLVTWPHSDCEVCFREGRSGLVPYIKAPLADGDTALELSKVFVGPNPHQLLACDAAKRLLSPGSGSVICLDVAISETSYRSW